MMSSRCFFHKILNNTLHRRARISKIVNNAGLAEYSCCLIFLIVLIFCFIEIYNNNPSCQPIYVKSWAVNI